MQQLFVASGGVLNYPFKRMHRPSELDACDDAFRMTRHDLPVGFN
jgi:hypothetical protein